MKNITDEVKPRTLVEICEQYDFHTELCGINYCSLALSKKLECPRQARYQDHNGLYPCLDLRWTKEVKYE